jgi:ribonuclease III
MDLGYVFKMKKKNIDFEMRISQAQATYGFEFKNPGYFELAWVHRSSTDTQGGGVPQYERLEFLGDSVVNMIVSDWLYKKWPSESEGDLSKKKSILVSAPVLAGCARQINLGDYLILGVSEEKNNGRERDGLLADAFEASVGALWLDQGLEACYCWLEKLLLSRDGDVLGDDRFQNYKSKLLEYSQSVSTETPVYTVLEEVGPDHLKEYKIRVDVVGGVTGVGVGRSKKKAEQLAAKEAVFILKSTGKLSDE